MDRQGQGSLVLVGRILSPVGLRGELRVEVLSDVPQRFSPGAVVFVDGSPIQIHSRRAAGRHLVVGFQGVNSRDAAGAMRDKLLYVSEGDVPPPPEDTYYYFQVLGMQVVTVEGEELGTVTDILTTGANDVYVVSREGKETLIPAIAGVVVKVEVGSNRMTVNLPEGL